MGQKGRPPKPTELKLLTGNPGKRPLPENEPKPKPITGSVAPPVFLNEHASEMWKRLFPILKNINLLTEADLESFTMLCQSYGIWVDCEVKLNDIRTAEYTNKGGNENEIEHPLSKVGQKAFTQYKSLCTEFGLTPASRSRIQITGADDNSDDIDMFLSR